jgi:cyclase
MFRPRVIPVLLLKGKGLVKSIKFQKYRYIGDPINAVKIFNDLKADELVFLDITASKEKRSISLELVKQIGSEAFMPFAIGGGIRNVKEAYNSVNGGAEKIVLNTVFIENPGVISEIAKELGTQSVVVSIDVKKNLFGNYHIYIKGGTKKTKINTITAAKRAEELGAGEIIINSIDHDGMMNGYNLDLIKKVSESVNVPVVACGGAGNLAHMKTAIDSGAHAAAAGSLFVYHGTRRAVLINYPDKDELKSIFGF